MLTDSIKALRNSAPSAITIHSELKAGDSYIQADPCQVHQLLMNIGTNAIQAIGDSRGEIIIRLSDYTLSQGEKDFPALKPGYYIKLTIEDNGAGMDQQTLEQVYDPFFTTKQLGDGHGMGMATVHGIIENLTGGITAASSPGQGTTFEILLPRLITEKTRDLDPGNLGSGNEHILLVDDEEELARMSRMLLSTLGYRVKTITEPKEALSLFHQNPDHFDLIITDQNMPELSGLEMAEEMLRTRADIPILICTGYSKEVTAEKIKNSGIRGVIIKPFSLQEVSLVIRQTLDS